MADQRIEPLGHAELDRKRPAIDITAEHGRNLADLAARCIDDSRRDEFSFVRRDLETGCGSIDGIHPALFQHPGTFFPRALRECARCQQRVDLAFDRAIRRAHGFCRHVRGNPAKLNSVQYLDFQASRPFVCPFRLDLAHLLVACRYQQATVLRNVDINCERLGRTRPQGQ